VKNGAVYWGRDSTDAVFVVGSFAPIAITQKRVSAHTARKNSNRNEKITIKAVRFKTTSTNRELKDSYVPYTRDNFQNR